MMPRTSKASVILFGLALLLMAAQFIPVSTPPKDDPGFFFWSGILAAIGGITGLAGVAQAVITRTNWLAATVPLLLNACLFGVFLKLFM